MCHAVFSREPEPVAVGAFVGYAMKMSQDSNYLYACEYQVSLQEIYVKWHVE